MRNIIHLKLQLRKSSTKTSAIKFRKDGGMQGLPSPSTFPEWAFQERSFFRYELLHQSNKSMARVGRIHTPHGIIDTPSYVPVATNAALKGVDFRIVDSNVEQTCERNESIRSADGTGTIDTNNDTDNDTDSDSLSSSNLIFSNTYHLILHPGREIIRDAGGLHKFTGRNQPFITDSGGFQVFSLAYGSVQAERNQTLETNTNANANANANADEKTKVSVPTSELKRGHTVDKPYRNEESEDPVEVTEDGVHFTSYRDGSKIFLTPEITVDAQKDFGADIIIPLDELPPHHISRSTLQESVNRSHRWEARSLKRHLENVKDQAMFAVIHGGLDPELRTESVEYLTSLPFDGYAIGGSLGKNRDELKVLLDWMMPMFDIEHRRNKPRHLLGIADEESIRNAVKQGIDTFDSCYPTKLGRHGTLLTPDGFIRIKQGKHVKSFGQKIDQDCECTTCKHYDRAYLHHLFKAKEPLAVMLGTEHNLFYMQNLMKRIRQDILNDKI